MKPLTRRERIETLLDHWPDFFDSGGAGTGGGGVFMLPGMSRHPSVVELGRALAELKAAHRGSFAHLSGFYASPYRTVERQRRIRGKNGKSGLVAERVRERVVPRWVVTARAVECVGMIAAEACD